VVLIAENVESANSISASMLVVATKVDIVTQKEWISSKPMWSQWQKVESDRLRRGPKEEPQPQPQSLV
jgi:hypothetical protein